MKPLQSTFSVPDNLVGRCNRVYGWRMDYGVQILNGYRQFMELKVQHEDWNDTLLSPSPLIERMWGQHLLDVQQYVNACKSYCNHVIGHDPGLNDAFRREKHKTCHIFLRARFPPEEYNDEIWCMQEDFTSMSTDVTLQEMNHRINSMLASHYGDKENEASDLVLKKIRNLLCDYQESKAPTPVVVPTHTFEDEVSSIQGEPMQERPNQEQPKESQTKNVECSTEKARKEKNEITLVLSYPGHEWILYRVPVKASFKKVFEHYADLSGTKTSNLKFRYKGKRLGPHDTPEHWGMTTKNVIIDVSLMSSKGIELVLSEELAEAQENGCVFSLW